MNREPMEYIVGRCPICQNVISAWAMMGDDLEAVEDMRADGLIVTIEQHYTLQLNPCNHRDNETDEVPL